MLASQVLNVIIFTLYFFAQGCLSSDILEDRDRLEQYFRDSLQNVRSEMHKGFPEYNIPPLEPLVLRDVRFNTTQEMAQIHLHFHEIKLTGLSSFQIQDMIADLAELKMGTKMIFPKLTASGWYKINGTVMRVLPIFGEGNYTIVARDAVLGGTGRLVLTAETMEVTDLEPHLDWGSIHLNLENFLGGGNFGTAVQRILPIIGKMAFQQFKPNILKSLTTFVTREINDQMTRPEVKSLVQKILGELSEIDETH